MNGIARFCLGPLRSGGLLSSWGPADDPKDPRPLVEQPPRTSAREDADSNKATRERARTPTAAILPADRPSVSLGA